MFLDYSLAQSLSCIWQIWLTYPQASIRRIWHIWTQNPWQLHQNTDTYAKMYSLQVLICWEVVYFCNYNVYYSQVQYIGKKCHQNWEERIIMTFVFWKKNILYAEHTHRFLLTQKLIWPVLLSVKINAINRNFHDRRIFVSLCFLVN